MRLSRFSLVSLAILGGATGCFGGRPMVQQQTVVAEIGEAESGDKKSAVRTSSSYIHQADSARDRGLADQANSQLVGAGLGDLELATEAYRKAIRLAPDSYEAHLGLGITFDARARALEETNPLRHPFVTAAKRELGQAYMLRQGPFEPLYYLAEVAVLEKDYARAKAFLEVLRVAGIKLGPVHALFGYIAEKEGDRTQAASSYTAALEAAGPIETLNFVAQRMKK